MDVEYLFRPHIEAPLCDGVSMGHYVMRSLPSGELGTDSMASCFAFIYITQKKEGSYVLMAHVATDGDEKWLRDLNLSQGSKDELFFMVTGIGPNKNTEARMDRLQKLYHIPKEHIKSNKDKVGGVVVSSVKADTKTVTITSCAKIKARDAAGYKAKTNAGWAKGNQVPLSPQTAMDGQNYENEFEG
ncbi:hypothetical protein [Desulfoluna spongiiphila]|uniref:Uncharacterized protein n=1 Tax=Desulfoluna spongiiphila TaxID=419481 RepID=A0A1G5DJU9_9BACT|nr:hypothetical protein [Desulfoluna spongiiphila]SCY14781.1 hypothetical protein SAMN05216233_104224 [Desulfoluna spongiiphila]